MFTKKQIILLTILIAVAAILAFIFYMLFKSTSTTTQPQPGGGSAVPGTQLPVAGERVTTTIGLQGDTTQISLPTSGIIPETSAYRPEAVTQISTDYAGYPSNNNDKGNYRYYNVLDGKFYDIDKDGKQRELADKEFYSVKDVTWAPTKDIAVIEYPDSSKIVYNFEQNSQVTLPNHWENFSFSPDSSQIAAKSIGLAPENRYLITTNNDGTETKIIEPMGNNGPYVDVNWSPSGQTVAFSRTGEALVGDRQEVLLVGLNGENFKSLTVEGSDFESKWSDTGKKLIYSVESARSDYKPELWITNSYGDTIGQDRKMLQIYTWPEKCAFSSDDAIYCAVPRSLPTGAGINKELGNSTYDDLYKIDITSGLRTPITTGEKFYSIKNMSYNKTKNKLIFTDINKTGVYEVNL